MCGIIGICSFKEDFSVKIDKWAGIMSDMGKPRFEPDIKSLYIDSSCVLGQSTLSPNELNNCSHPVVKHLSGKTYATVGSAVIYNKKELKSSLLKEGAVFDTGTDAEIILEGFMRQGMDFVNDINGVFAFVIWDGISLWLFRDKAGIKPLFYTLLNDRIIFSSNIKGILTYPGINAVIGREGLCQIFGLGPARVGGSGVFEGINEIRAGFFGVYKPEVFNTFKYWDVKSEPHTDNYKDTVEKTAWLVKDAIKLQAASDEPVASMLSGGVDSSIVTAVAGSELKKSGQRINTFSFDFAGNDKYFTSTSFQPDRDRPWVDIMVNFTNSNHSYFECTTRDMADLLYDSVKAKDLPGMADIDSSLLYFLREMRKYNKAALTGECADEIFGGYPWFHKKEMMDAGTFPWSIDLAARKAQLSDDLLNTIDIDEYVNSKYHETINEVPILDGEPGEEKRRREIAYLNLKWFMATLIDRLDRMSTYAGIEARAPFADYRIMEYIWNVPWDIKCAGGEVKHLLRAAAKGMLPDEVLYRKKSPYPKSYNPEYEKILNRKIIDILNDTSSPILNLIDKKKTENFITSTHDYGKPWFGQLMAGPQKLAYLIQIDFWLREYGVEIKI